MHKQLIHLFMDWYSRCPHASSMCFPVDVTFDRSSVIILLLLIFLPTTSANEFRQMSDSEISLMAINVTGLFSLSRRLIYFDWIKEMNFDVVIFTEVNTDSISTFNDLSSDYNILLSPATRKQSRLYLCSGAPGFKWGVAMLIKKRLKIIDSSTSWNSVLDSRLVRVRLLLNHNPSYVTIYGIYGPALDSEKEAFHSLVHNQLIKDKSDPIIIAGDFNSHILSSEEIHPLPSNQVNTSMTAYTNPPLSLIDVRRAIGTSSNILHNYTYSEHRGYHSIIDFVLTSHPFLFRHFHTFTKHRLPTFHNPIGCILKLDHVDLSMQHSQSRCYPHIDLRDKYLISIFRQKALSWYRELSPELKNTFSSSDTPLQQRTAQLQPMLGSIYKLTVEDAATVFPSSHRKRTRHYGDTMKNLLQPLYIHYKCLRLVQAIQNHLLPQLNQPLQAAKLMQKLRVHWNSLMLSSPLLLDNFEDPEYKSLLIAEIRSSKKLLWKKIKNEENQIRKKSRENFQRWMNVKRNWNSSLMRWRYYPRISNIRLPTALIHPLDQNVHTNSLEIVEIQRLHYIKLGQPSSSPSPMPYPFWLHTRSSKAIQERIAQTCTHSLLDLPIPQSLLDYVFDSCNHTSPGLDMMQGVTLKILPKSVRKICQVMVETFIQSGSFPEEVTDGMIFSLYKGSGPSTAAESYRGITGLNSLYKKASSVINILMTKCLREGKAYSGCQGATRPGSVSAFKATVPLCMFAIHRNKKKEIHEIDVDIRQAFDRLAFVATHDSFRFHGLHKMFLKFQEAVEKGNRRRCYSHHGLSEFFRIEQGTQQGDGWSPAKFCLALEMFFWWLIDENKGITITKDDGSSVTIGSSGFVDDLSIYGSRFEDILAIFNNFCEFGNYYGLPLNIRKCLHAWWHPDPNYRPPPILAKDYDGSIQTVKQVGQNEHFRKLGFWTNSVEDWNRHKILLREKFVQAGLKLKGGYAPLLPTVQLVNADLIGIFTYSAQLVPFNKRDLLSLQSITADPIRKNGRVSKAVSAPALAATCNLQLLQALDGAVKIDFLYRCLNSEEVDPQCHFLVTKLIDSCPSESPIFNVLERPRKGVPKNFVAPQFIWKTVQYLKKLNMSINRKYHPVTVDLFSISHLKEWAPQGFSYIFRKLQNSGLTSLSDFSPPFKDSLQTDGLMYSMVERMILFPEDTKYSESSILLDLEWFKDYGCRLSPQQYNYLRTVLLDVITDLQKNGEGIRFVRKTIREKYKQTSCFVRNALIQSLNSETVASDGSKCKQHAGFGVYNGSTHIGGLVPGMPCSFKAELTGLLVALVSHKPNCLRTVYIDNSATIEHVNSLLNEQHLWKPINLSKFSWLSITRNIVHVIQTSQPAVQLLKVRAHTASNDLKSVFNREADSAASYSASRANHRVVHDCWNYVQDRYIKIEDSLFEGNVRKIVYAKLLNIYLEEFAETHPRLNFKIFHKSSSLFSLKDPDCFSSRITFLIRLICKALPTFRLQKLRFPEVYASDACAFCGDREDDVHLFCECEHFNHLRSDTWSRILDYVSQLTKLDLTRVRATFPPWLHGFSLGSCIDVIDNTRYLALAGQIPIFIFKWLKSRLGPIIAQRACCRIHSMIIDCVEEIWKQRNEFCRTSNLLFKEARSSPTPVFTYTAQLDWDTLSLEDLDISAFNYDALVD